MAKSLNQFDLKDAGGTGKAGQAVNTNNRKKNLPDLTTSFANALTQGSNALMDNTAKAIDGVKKAASNTDVQYKNYAERNTAKKQNLGNLNSSAVSSLVGSNATQEERKEAALRQNKIMGAAHQNLAAQQERSKGNTAYMLSDIIGQTNGMSSSAVSSLTGSNATAKERAEATNRQTTFANAARKAVGAEPVKQITDWSTGDPLTNRLVNALDQKTQTSWEQADEIAAAAQENYGQYLTPRQQTISNVITNIEDNSIRMGKRMALSFLTGGSSLLTGVVGDTAMYLSSAGEALKDARDKGYSDDTARKYASVVGIANAGLEHLGDPTGTESYGLGLDQDLGNIIKSAQFMSPKTKWVANWLAGGFEEGLEEMLTEAVTQKAEQYYLDETITNEQQIADRINAFGMGMISSLFLSGVLQGDMMPGGYQKYAGEIALDYWRMDNAERSEVVNALANEFNVDPRLLQKSIEDHALDAVKYMDGETLMRAIENAPVAIMPNGEGVYEYFGDTTKQQKDALKLAARPGNKAYLVETLGTDSKGYAIPSATLDDGTILISSEVEDPMNGIATHEVVHVAQDPEFIAAANQAMREIEGSKFDTWFDSLKGAYAPMYTDQASTAANPIQRNQENIDIGKARYESDPDFRQKLDEEVASYFAQYHLLKDQKTFDRFMNRTGNLLQRTIQSLKDNFAGTGDQTLVSNLENQYTKMVRNYQKQNRGNFLSRLAGNLNTNKLSPQVSYSLKSMGIDLAMGTDSDMVQDLLNTGVFQTSEEASAFVNNVNQLMDLLSQRAFLDMHEEADRETRAFSPIKKNSDKLYEISLDYSTLCKKRIITQAIIEKLNVERGQAMDARTQFAITELLRQYQQQESKLQVACALCYVEAARLKSPKVINQFINDPAKYMTSYFVKQGGSEGKQIVADAQNNFKEMLGVDPKATKTDMADSVAQRMTVGQFNDVLRSIGADEIDGDPDAMVSPQKVKNAYNNYAVKLREGLYNTLTEDQKAAIELAKSLDRKYYLTAQGLTDLKMGNVNGQYNPLARDIYNAFTNRVTTATRSKAIETDVAYYYGDAKGVSDSLIERMNAENGIRTQSWSDFTMQHLLDEITSTAELATRNAKMHGYTKVPEYVLVKGKTGEMINNSLIPLGRTGFDEYGNLAFSPTEGMPIEESNRLRGIFPNTDGSICIGINDEQIRALLRDDRIDYVIPYHVSGLTSHLRTIAGINKWSNYTGTQNETPIPGRKQGAAIKFSDWYTDDIKNQKKPGIEIMMDAQQKYLDLCAERGYVPKFPQFLINNGDGTYSIDPENPNYWKLLIDRKMINQLNGKIIEQKAVRPDFNWEDTYVNGERVPGLFSLVKEAEDPMTTELVERMASVVRNAIDDGTVNAIAENNPNVRGVMDFFIQNNPIEQLGEEDVDEYEWNGDPYDPETRVQENLPAAMYSLSDEELDRQYFDALNRGDTEEAQRLRFAHASENGYIDRAYHGTQAFGFTEPDVSYSDDGKSFFVTDDRDVAKTYAGTDVVKPISGNNGTWLDNEIHNTEKQIDASVNDFIDALNQVAGNTNWHPDVSQLNSDLWTIASNYVDNTAVNANSSLSKDIDDELFHWIGKAWQEANPGENNMMPWLMSSESDYVSEVEDKVIDRFGRFINLINGTDTNRGIYDLVINPDNLLEHDAKGKKWNDLDIINEQGGKTKGTTRSLADYAQGEGYNGYVLNNVFDDGGFGATRQQNPATVYDLFDPGSQVKSADAVTYDDNGNVIPLSQRDNPLNPDIRYSLDNEYMEAVNSGDIDKAQSMVDEKANQYLNELLLPNDDDIEGFKFHKGSAPQNIKKRYAVFNVSPEGFKAAYAGNKVATPVGVWLDAVNLDSYVSDVTQFDDGSFASYIVGDTGASAKDKFSDEKLKEYGIKPSAHLLLERGGKHSTDVPNFSQMNLKQDENGNKVNSAKDGALPHNKLIFEIEYGYDEDLTDYVKEHGRISNGRNQGLAKIQPNQFYDFKTNPNAVGNWGIGGTFRITRLVPYSEVVSVTEQYKKDAVAEANNAYDNGEITKAERDKRIKNANAITTQKWVGGYHPEDFGLSVESVDQMYRDGQKMKLTDAITYDDNGNVIPLDQRFNPENPDIRYSLADGTEEIATYIPDGQYADGTNISFIDEILDGNKKGETRTHKSLTRKWVGLAKNGQVYGRVRFGKPFEITRNSPEYRDAMIAGTNYDIPEGGSKYYYPVLETEDFRDNPRPIIRNGNYGQYRYALNEDIPEQANAFPDRNYPQDRSAMRMLGQMSRDRVTADPLTYESISPESFPVPDRIQDYIDLIEDEEDRKYGFDEAPEKELSDEDRDMYKSIAGNKSGALQGFATPTQMFNNMMGKEGEQREFFRDRYERPMFDTKKEYNANREQRWQALENIIKETGIEANTPESAAVQWYGEKAKPNEAGETIPYTLADLKKEFPNKWQDIVKMERFMRGMYDEYVGRINAALEQVYPNLEEKAQAQLESWRNKKRIYQDEIEMSRSPVANEYWEGEIAKLDKKIAKLEGDLESGEYFRNKRLNPRKDYFHHFQEVETKGIGGLKNILQASTLIDPQLVGKTEFTKPKSRWMSWLQKRGQGAYTADAVLGMGKYIDSAEYAIAFDPLIAQYRDEISNMVKATRDTKNANQLIQYLSSYTNQLAGKTASLDRTILDLLGEGNRGQLFNALAAINNRAKSNAVVGNVRSAVAQFFNIPNAMSIIKSNSAWAKGVRDYANAKLGNRELLDQSPFLQERYFDHNVDDLKARNTDWEKITGKIGDITNEMMTFGDREATELIWLAAYNEGIENGVSDPTYYADDLTRQSVAGRGIGEVPYNMKSKVASFFMPFQVETNNQWQNLKGMLKDKDAKGVFRLMLGAYLMNAMVKPLFNDGVLPDIIDVLVQGLRKLFDKDREESVGEIALDTGKRMAGEAVSFIPGTSLWLPAIMSSDSAEALFGDSDPTRYGTGTVGLSTITKTLADALDGDGQFDLMTPLLQLGLPYGGKQASRLYNTLQDMNILPSNGTMNTPFGGEKNPLRGDYSKAGALKYQLPEEVDSFGDAAEIARAFLFGSNATNAAQEYFDTLKPVLNKTQVEKLKENPEVDPQTYIDYVHQANVDGKNGISQAEAYNWLSSHDLSDEEKNALWSMTNSAWTKTYDEYTPQNETIVENADTNGDGRVTQAEAYSWLSKQDDISDEEKNAMWDENGWSTSYDKYDKAHKGVLGYNRKTLTEAVDQDGNGMMKQQELYFWLQNQGYTEQEKADLWDLAGWKTDYQSYANKMKSKTPTTETTRKVKSTDELMGKEAPKSPSGITNRKELLIAADSNNDGYMSQKEAYTYLSGTDLSEEEKEALWNLSNWKTSYQKYAQKNG